MLLYRPDGKPEHLLDSKRVYSVAFVAFKATECFQSSQAGRILSNFDQYYSGKGRAKEVSDAKMEGGAGAKEISSGSEKEDYSENNEISSEFEDAEADATTEIISDSLFANILEKAAIGVHVPSKRNEFNRPKINYLSQNIRQPVWHTILKYNLGKSLIAGIVSSHNLCSLSAPKVCKTLEDMISAESIMNEYKDTGAFSTFLPTSTEIIVRPLEEAIKDVQKKTNSTERADANIESDVIINGSLNQISQKLTLDERQDIAFKLRGVI